MSNKLVRVTLSEEHYQIAQLALSMLDPDNAVDAAEVENAVRSFAANKEEFGGPLEVEVDNADGAREIRHIPMMLRIGDNVPIGFGHIVNSDLQIKVHSVLLVQAIDRLISAEEIKELYLGVGIRPKHSYSAQRREAAEVREVKEREQVSEVEKLGRLGHSNAYIAKQLGLSESTVRTILEHRPKQ